MKTALVICHTGLSSTPRTKGYDQVEHLYLDGEKKNVEIRVQNIEQKIVATLSPLARDLLEIASVLYVADTSISRGQTDVYGRDWQRKIHIVIPVRRPRVWNKAKHLLSELVTYLSGDVAITFDFRAHQRPRTGQGYLEFPAQTKGFRRASRIVLFSGGLDSLAGTAEVVMSGEIPLLISHRSVSTRVQVQESLLAMLASKAHVAIPAIGVWVTRTEKQAVDNSQRLRSFLYMSLAATLAHELKITEIWYCENGITTFNLPLSLQRIGSRSTRTTHPKVVGLFEQLCELVFSSKLQVKNPFVFATKRDVIEKLLALNCQDMIATSLSCTRTFAVQKTKRHCGVCFQCIARRFAVITARAEPHDPIDDYVKDIFTHSLAKGQERATAIDWVSFNVEVAKDLCNDPFVCIKVLN